MMLITNLVEPKKQFRLAIMYFLLAASGGFILRLFPIVSIDHNYKFILHAHSHITLLGWIYLGLSTVLYHLFLKDAAIQKSYHRLLLLTHISLIGMLLSFPIQGYALFSILFSTLFLFCSYWFTFLFIKHTHKESKGISYRFAVSGLIFLVISSIGPWALGAIITISGPESVWYRIAIYFYLHFLYNGAFIGIILSLLFHFAERKGIMQDIKQTTVLLIIWITSVLFTFFLSALFAFDNILIYTLSGIGNILQILFVFLTIKYGKETLRSMNDSYNPSQRLLFKLFLICFILKIFLQALSGFPYFAELTTHYLDFVIAYLHLVFLGILTTAIFLYGSVYLSLRLHIFPVLLFMFGFLLSEGLIIYRGMSYWLQLPFFREINLLIAVFSFLMIAGTGGILYINRK